MSELDLTEDERKAVEKAIGEPFMEDFSDNTLRIRRNLLAVTSVALFYKLGGLSINSTSALFGIKLDGLTPDKVDWAFFLALCYLFAHFLWNSLDHFKEWRLRLTGSKVAFITAAKFGSELVDTPAHPRQSTLYTYLLGKRRVTADLERQIADIERRMAAWPKEEGVGEAPSATNLKPHVDSVMEVMKGIKQKLVYLDRIPVSLARFEKGFRSFRASQSARWLVLEWGMPLALGIWALFLTFPYALSLCIGRGGS